MKKISFVFLLLFNLFNTKIYFAGVNGKVIKSIKFYSQILDTIVNYSIYLPPSYEESTKKYPVLYLLHGYTDNENTWLDNAFVNQVADQKILSKEIDEMIIVMPNGGLKWFVNQPNGDFNYEDMFIKEFIPYIEQTYRIKADKKHRAISGLSMGGYAALGYAMRHPDIFATCVAYSAAIRPDDEVLKTSQKHFDYLYAHVYGKNVKGKARLSEHWNNNNPIYLAKTISVEKLKSVNWYITCGDDDWLYYGNSVLRKIFRDRGIPHEYRVMDGRHNWYYWRTHIGEGLKYISERLNIGENCK